MSASKPEYLSRFRRAAFGRRERHPYHEVERSSSRSTILSHSDFVNSLDSRSISNKQLPSDSKSCSICLDPYQIKPPVQRQRIGISCLERKTIRPSSSSSSDSPDSPTSCDQRNKSNSLAQRRSSVLSSPRDDRPVQVPCGHIFGKECLREWLKRSNQCPLCRRDMCRREDGYRVSTGYLDELDRNDLMFELLEYEGIEAVGDSARRAVSDAPNFSELCDYLWTRMI